ncbi:multicopper oxidase [Phlyctema vagabunda]|uniref:Multicopper oxidase n=1 Tax=Phlyctema vagabunda TaxID=108571 RepID=A0ABR4PT79_9HELO
MALFGRLWAVVTYYISIVSVSPASQWSTGQAPLQVLPHYGTVNRPPVNANHEPAVEADEQVPDYPTFPPPGGKKDTKFRCEYPEMAEWEDCSHELDRKCWLRRKSDGKQFDINTDYENFWPKGIIRKYNINLAETTFAADGLDFTFAKLFNKKYPGPWIEACWGDRLIVNVTNSLPHNGTSVHWHGIRQLNTTHMDGVNGITQCPIAPGDYFAYNFTLHQYGSSWYHSHYSVQYADGAAGPMTIHGPSSADWDEAVSPPLILTDWYHNSAFSVVSNGPNGGKDILLNGRGNITRFSGGATLNTTTIQPALNITFESPRPGQGCKKYLIRVINTSFDTTFVFSIDNHLLQVASADFVPIQPYRNTSILVGIGQRYTVVVEANPLNESSPLAADGNYWIRTQIASCFGQTGEPPTGYDEVGILRYNASSKSDPTTKRWPGISLDCSDEAYTSLHPILPWTVKAPSNGDINAAAPRFGEEFDVAFTGGNKKTKPYPLASFMMDNSNRSVSMRINYSDPIFLHLNPDPKKKFQIPELWRVQPENYTNNEWIYLVLHGLGGKTTAHPIHLHGHDFALLEQASNKTWDPYNMDLKLNNPPRRDVVLLPTDGYVVIAFKADNPGPWLIHCHIAFHISKGLGMQIMEDQAEAFKIWPDDDSAIVEAERVCKNWRDWQSNITNWANPPISRKGNCTEEDIEMCFQDDSGV